MTPEAEKMNGDESLPHDYFSHWMPITLPKTKETKL